MSNFAQHNAQIPPRVQGQHPPAPAAPGKERPPNQAVPRARAERKQPPHYSTSRTHVSSVLHHPQGWRGPQAKPRDRHPCRLHPRRYTVAAFPLLSLLLASLLLLVLIIILFLIVSIMFPVVPMSLFLQKHRDCKLRIPRESNILLPGFYSMRVLQ